MRVLITGGAGFIGSHLCDRFIEEGHKVICMDNLITGRKENIAHLSTNKNFKFIRHDVTKYIDLKGKIDYILHFASPASPVDYLKYPIQTMKVGALGTHNALGVAKKKKARFLLASTSEVYGDPLVHPQKEDYWGNVNPVGPRGVYDESKRFAEAITMAYHRVHKIDTKIVRIFNSILADQMIIAFEDGNMYFEEIGRFVTRLDKNHERGVILVPSFDSESLRMKLKLVSAVIKHPYDGDTFELILAYGRRVKVTGHHSVFKKGKEGRPIAVPVRDLKKGDYVAVPSKLSVIEKDVKRINITEEIIRLYPEKDLWDFAIYSDAFQSLIDKQKKHIYEILDNSNRYNAKRYNNNLFCQFNKYRHGSFLPLYVLHKLNIPIPRDARIRIFSAGAHIYIKNQIKLSDDILWLLGFFIAEGCAQYKRGKTYSINFSSDSYLLKKAKVILEQEFGVHVVSRHYEKDKRSPAIFIHSKLLYFVFEQIFKAIKKTNRENEIPAWILQLPLKRLKYFLEGFREGDGTHTGKKLGNELCFDTTSKMLALQLNMALLRFGIVASFGEYKTTFKKKYGSRKFAFYRLTVCELSDFNILQWDKGVRQKLLASRNGDIVWAWIKKIKKCKSTMYVYDFSVPGAENFVAGTAGVYCHNTYGPRMRPNDGRAIPNFISQAIQNKPLTIYGDGSQTRSFCYIDDMVDGICKLALSDVNEPINLGNPNEASIKELANKIINLTKTKNRIIFKSLPVDDPKVRCPDIAKARKFLKWQPNVSLDDGIAYTINCF